jgi:hypothetical protein
MTDQIRRIIRLLNKREIQLVQTVRPVTIAINFDDEADEFEVEFDTLRELE